MTPAEITAWARAALPRSQPGRPRPSPTVALDGRAAAAHGFGRGDVTHAPAGAVLVAADGTALVVSPEGALDAWPPFGRRSIASEPRAGSASTTPRGP